MFRTNSLSRRLHSTKPILNRLEDRAVPAIFTVSSIADNGLGTLRSAVIAANQQLGPDVINFSSKIFLMPRTITLTSGELQITDSLTVTGNGAAMLTINGNSAGRVFDVNGPGTINVTLSGMTISGGKVAGAG